MKLLRKENEKKDTENEYELSDEELDEIKSSLSKEELLDLEGKMKARLELIKDQIADAKGEYDKTLNELVPLKWELLKKKSELEQLKSEYDVVSLQLNVEKSELEEIHQKIEAAKSKLAPNPNNDTGK